MKLFVWHGAGVLEDYTTGQITAIAPDLESAFLAIKQADSLCRTSSLPPPADIINLGDVTVEPRAWVTWGGG